MDILEVIGLLLISLPLGYALCAIKYNIPPLGIDWGLCAVSAITGVSILISL